MLDLGDLDLQASGLGRASSLPQVGDRLARIPKSPTVNPKP